MVGKQCHLEDKGYDLAALDIALGSESERHLQAGYASIQERYVKWALARDMDPYTANPTQLINWLVIRITINKWKPTTVNAYYKAIKYMYEDCSVFADDQDFLAFLATVKCMQVKVLQEWNVDLSPIKAHLLQQDIRTLDIKTLLEHLCWMLCVVGFL